MMKILLFVLLIPLCTNAIANENWTLIHEDKATKTTFYVKLDNFKLFENKVRMWVMESFATPQKVKKLEYSSLKSLIQVDCGAKKLRYMAYSLYKNKKAQGVSIYNKGVPSEWLSVNSNTINSAYMNIACEEAKAS